MQHAPFGLAAPAASADASGARRARLGLFFSELEPSADPEVDVLGLEPRRLPHRRRRARARLGPAQSLCAFTQQLAEGVAPAAPLALRVGGAGAALTTRAAATRRA
eukprot:6189615-Pleurochrysis_carterae.AAC.4